MNSTSRKQPVQRRYDHMVKLLLIGNSGVGKSSILMQYSDKKFAHNYYNTIGVDYKIKYMQLNGLTIKLQIWDTAGQDRFKTITSSYYRGADGIIIVYDITDRMSFDNVKTWIDEIEKYVDEKTKKYIIGNKIDLEQKRQVPSEEGNELASKMKTPFKQTSARLSTNIDQVFEDLVERILNTAAASNSRSQLTNQSGPEGQEKQAGTKENQKLNIKDLYENKKKEKDSCCNIY